MVGLTRFELVTPRLSSVCSNQLSYRPGILFKELTPEVSGVPVLSKLDSARVTQTTHESQIDLRVLETSETIGSRLRAPTLRTYSRKEVIQPQVLLQLPCYDFTPITDHTLGASLPCGLMRRLLVQPAFVM